MLQITLKGQLQRDVGPKPGPTGRRPQSTYLWPGGHPRQADPRDHGPKPALKAILEPKYPNHLITFEITRQGLTEFLSTPFVSNYQPF